MRLAAWERKSVGVPEKGSFSVPVHSGISGKVTDISDMLDDEDE